MNETNKSEVKLTSYSHGAGCGCKISPSILSRILSGNETHSNIESLLVGNHSRDDAAVLDMGNGTALISTTDFFIPIVIDPFDFWSGANFRLRVKQVAGYPNYDDSIFESPSSLMNGDDEKLEALWKTEFSLQELVSREKFKSAEELQKRLDFVLGSKSVVSAIREQEDELESFSESTSKEDDIMKELEASYSRSKSNSVEVNEDEDEEDALAYFSKLAE